MFAAMGALDLAVTSDVVEPPFRQPRLADFTLTGRAAGKVVILGAGIAGLACAYELGKAGYDCTILEAQNRTGGRNFTVRTGTSLTDLDDVTQTAGYSDDQYLNAGPGRIAQWMVTLDYCRELGVPLEVFTNINADAYIYREKNGMKPGFPVRRRAAKADTYGYVSELLAKATDQGALDKMLTPEDKDKLLSLLRHWGKIGKKVEGDPGKSYQYTGAKERGYSVWPAATGVPGVELTPVPTLSELLASEVGRELEFETDFKQAEVMLQPVGGMDAIPVALTKAIGMDRIKLRSPVTQITSGPGSVTVKYVDGNGRAQQMVADYCIATLPPHLLARVPHNLGPDVQRALNTFRQVNAGKIGLEYRSRWWENEDRIYGGVTETDLDITHIWYPAYQYHSPRGLLVGYYNTGNNADFYAGLKPGQREARAIMQGMKIHGPKYKTELATSWSVAWSRVPYIEGAWQKIPHGPQSPVYAPLNQAAGRVYFSGDWLSNVVSWQHGAFTSARKVVTMLHSRVLTV
jgi:monoamine oxidase